MPSHSQVSACRSFSVSSSRSQCPLCFSSSLPFSFSQRSLRLCGEFGFQISDFALFFHLCLSVFISGFQGLPCPSQISNLRFQIALFACGFTPGDASLETRNTQYRCSKAPAKRTHDESRSCRQSRPAAPE